MRKLTLRLFVAVIACTVGIAVANTWSSLSPARFERCRNLVSVEQQPDSPVGISLLSVDCAVGVVNIGYRVDANTTRLIKGYRISASKGRQGTPDRESSSMGRGTSFMGVTPTQITPFFGLFSENLSRGFFRRPVDHVTLYVSTVTFVDGSEWQRADDSR